MENQNLTRQNSNKGRNRLVNVSKTQTQADQFWHTDVKHTCMEKLLSRADAIGDDPTRGVMNELFEYAAGSETIYYSQ